MNDLNFDNYPDPDELEYQEKVRASKRKNAKLAMHDSNIIKPSDRRSAHKEVRKHEEDI